MYIMTVQYRQLIPAPVDLTSASVWLHKQPSITLKQMASKSMTHIAC